jgi:hypothetical protein
VDNIVPLEVGHYSRCLTKLVCVAFVPLFDL